MGSIATIIRRASSLLVLVALAAASASTSASECQRPVYLTFDVGNMRHAEFIANVLNRKQIKATFFIANNKTMRGDHVLDASWGDYWRARVAEGHVFGNHTWSHRYARKDKAGRLDVTDQSGKHYMLNERKFCQEFTRVNEGFEKLTGKSLSPIWRAPGGHTTDLSVHWAANCGYPVHVLWSQTGLVGDELPSDQYPSEVLIKRAIGHAKAGDIFLMHL
ncbi:MAG: polysaccharide deacetylase family protein, partial [Acidiferrobacterales bacterium]|nr:polysaccharide deacetylase family protein [Acidiferrobacterales bacterium]